MSINFFFVSDFGLEPISDASIHLQILKKLKQTG